MIAEQLYCRVTKVECILYGKDVYERNTHKQIHYFPVMHSLSVPRIIFNKRLFQQV